MADAKERIPPEIHRQQVALYRDRRDAYVAFATLLDDVLAKACAPAVPTAVVQTRAKTIASFAEKCAIFGMYLVKRSIFSFSRSTLAFLEMKSESFRASSLTLLRISLSTSGLSAMNSFPTLLYGIFVEQR